LRLLIQKAKIFKEENFALNFEPGKNPKTDD